MLARLRQQLGVPQPRLRGELAGAGVAGPPLPAWHWPWGGGTYYCTGLGTGYSPQAVPPCSLAAAAAPLLTQDNPGDGPLRLALADGSVVSFQAHSSIRDAAPFGAAGRTLRLRGAALFAVAKDARHPFTVEAGGFTTTALGTK